MGKSDGYIGGYLLLDDVESQQSELLASNLCVVGMPLALSYDPDSAKILVSTAAGQNVGTVRPSNRMAFKEALEGGWTCRAWLSLVYYDNSVRRFGGEIAYQLFDSEPGPEGAREALESYAEKTARRLADGQRPDVALSGTEYRKVLETGDLQPTEKVPLPIDTGRGGGKVVFKHKRTVSDKLAQAAVERRPGCLAAAAVALLVLVGAVVFALWSCYGPH